MNSQIVLSILILSLSTSLSFPTASATTPTSPPPSSVSYDVQDHSFFSHTALLGPILSHLGFNELSMAAPSLASDTTATAWSGPSTLFAPSDSSLRSCLTCSVPHLLREHIVPGLFTIEYLRKLSFGTKIETLSPGHCLTITSSTVLRKNDTSASGRSVVFVGGVEITHPDLFNNGLVVIHGIQGYISPLSPFSCDFERLNTLAFPHYSPVEGGGWSHALPVQPAMMRLMMRDAMLRLRNNGFSILSLAMRVKYGELVGLNNFTVFAVDDVTIFSGWQSYISSIRMHIVPNEYLTASDVERMALGRRMRTLEREQSLVVTSGGRINYVRMKVGEVVRNMKIIVHSVYMPFPRIHPNMEAEGGVGLNNNMEVGRSNSVVVDGGGGGGCLAESKEDGTCSTAPTTSATATTTSSTLNNMMSPLPPMPSDVKTSLIDTDDHYGL